MSKTNDYYGTYIRDRPLQSAGATAVQYWGEHTAVEDVARLITQLAKLTTVCSI